MKKIIYVVLGLTDLLAIATIPLDSFVFNIPKYVSPIFAIVVVCMTILLWHEKKKGKMIFTIVNVLVLLVLYAGTYCNPYRNSINYKINADYTCREFGTVLTYEDAVRDIDYALKHLQEVHPLYVSGLSENMKKLKWQAKENLKSYDEITVNDLCREIEQILSNLEDAHTAVYANYSDSHYLKYIEEHKQQGDKLVELNGLSMEELFDSHSRLFSYEVEAYGVERMKNYLFTLEGLDYLGIDSARGMVYTYETTDGQRINVTYYPEDFVTSEEYWEFNNMKDNQSGEEEYHFVSYEIIPEYDLAVFKLLECKNDDEYRRCLKDFFSEVKEKGIHNVCVDLRNNGGGSSSVADEFIHYLNTETYKVWGQDWRLGSLMIKSQGSTEQNSHEREWTFSGDVYILTSIDTFSAAMDFAMLIADNDLGTIIGEASGNKPDSYGDVVIFRLPKSGLYMQCSMKKWYRLDTDCQDELIEPDIPCESAEALNVLEKLLKP